VQFKKTLDIKKQSNYETEKTFWEEVKCGTIKKKRFLFFCR
jgi:hypothetical protein